MPGLPKQLAVNRPGPVREPGPVHPVAVPNADPTTALNVTCWVASDGFGEPATVVVVAVGLTVTVACPWPAAKLPWAGNLAVIVWSPRVRVDVG